ncbi:hypothetical protein T09_2117 [Trichinella sp. T9]|nr:hypothetical protein T09_2117 [Trichinella sp. T9]
MFRQFRVSHCPVAVHRGLYPLKEQMWMARQTRRKLPHHRWRFASSKPPSFPFCMYVKCSSTWQLSMGSFRMITDVTSSSSAVALCWLLLARAVSSSSRHSQGSLPHVLYVSTSVTTLAPNTLTAGWSSPLQYIEGFRRRGARGGGFDPLPQRTVSDQRALGSMTERHAVQGMTKRPAEQSVIEHRLVGSCRSVARSHPRSSPAASFTGRDGSFYCRGCAAASARPAMSNAAE